MKSYNESTTYREFKKELHRALERIFFKNMLHISLIMDELKSLTIDIAVSQLSYLYTTIQSIEQRLEPVFLLATDRIYEIYKKIKLYTYVLTSKGVLEALSRADGTSHRASVTPQELDEVLSQPFFNGAEPKEAIKLQLNILKRKIISEIEISIIQKEDAEKVRDRIERVFPKEKIIKRAPDYIDRVQRKGIKEAEKEFKRLSVFLGDEDVWAGIVEEYQRNFLPTVWRGIEKQIQYQNIKYYPWELEQQLTHEFVATVRQAEKTTSEKVGIKDFIWIAIIDDRTCNTKTCSCVWRDGLTTTEIEAELKKRKDEVCRAVVPPAHLNCRCDLAPATEELVEYPVTELGDFETWLED